MMTIKQNLALIMELCIEGLAEFGASGGGTTLENLCNHRSGARPAAASTPAVAASTPLSGELLLSL